MFYFLSIYNFVKKIFYVIYRLYVSYKDFILTLYVYLESKEMEFYNEKLDNWFCYTRGFKLQVNPNIVYITKHIFNIIDNRMEKFSTLYN